MVEKKEEKKFEQNSIKDPEELYNKGDNLCIKKKLSYKYVYKNRCVK